MKAVNNADELHDAENKSLTSVSWENWNNIHHKKLRSDINFLGNKPNSRKFELLKLLQHVNVIWDAC